MVAFSSMNPPHDALWQLSFIKICPLLRSVTVFMPIAFSKLLSHLHCRPLTDDLLVVLLWYQTSWKSHWTLIWCSFEHWNISGFLFYTHSLKVRLAVRNQQLTFIMLSSIFSIHIHININRVCDVESFTLHIPSLSAYVCQEAENSIMTQLKR